MLGVLLIIILLIGVSSYLVGNKVYKSLKNKNETAAIVYGIIAALLLFGLLAAGIFILLSNIVFVR